MYSREKWNFSLHTPLRNFLIREYHELLDHHMSISSFTFSDIHHIPIFIQVEVALCRFEDDFSFFFSASGQEMIEKLEVLEDFRWYSFTPLSFL
jgi:hypothetical protein